MNKATEKFPDMTSVAMMEECGNKYHDGKNVNEDDANINDINES